MTRAPFQGYVQHGTSAPTPVQGTELDVCRDVATRQVHGLAKYGISVADSPLTLRAWMQHAYEEALDKAVYLKRVIGILEEIERCPVPIPYTSALGTEAIACDLLQRLASDHQGQPRAEAVRELSALVRIAQVAMGVKL